MRRFFQTLFAVLLLGMPGCAPLEFGDETLTASQYRTQGVNSIAAKDYAKAARSFEKAIAQSPQNADLYLLQAEVLEALERYKAARKNYQSALSRLDPADEALPQLRYRLALLQALKFTDLRRAGEALDALPAPSPERFDLEGVLAYQRKQYPQALSLFKQAQSLSADPETQARILYHAALAFNRIGDDTGTFSSLFHAINKAQGLSLTKDIERFYHQIKAR